MLLGGSPRIVCLRVAPAVEDVTAEATVSARVAGSFRGRCAVIDYPDLTEAAHGKQNLIQIGVVVDRIGVIPIGTTLTRGVVDVDQFRMIGHHTVVGLCGIIVLYEMVPGVPLPNDIASRNTHRFDFDDVVRPQFAVGQQARVSARRDRIGLTDILPSDHQHVAVG